MQDIKSLQKGVKESSEEIWVELKSLAVIVQRKHYPRAENPDDLISEALLSACEAIEKDKENGNYRNLRSYIYTVMRNTMSNMLFHSNKELPLDDLCGAYQENYECREGLDFVGIVDKVLKGLPVRYKVYRESLIGALSDLCAGEIPQPVSEGNSDTDKLFSLVLWKLKEEVEDNGP